MNDFDKVFADDIEDEVNFDTLFNNDSDLIDLIGSHILESAEEYHCYNKKCEDDKDDDDEDDIEEISSNNDPSQDGAEGVDPVKEKCGGNTVKEKCGSNDDTVKEKCGGCSRKENCYGDQCDNEVPAVNTTADLGKVLHSDNYSNSVVDSPKDVIAPAINIPQNTTDLDKIMNNEPGPKVIEEPQNQEGCRNQESCKDKRYCESIEYTSELDALFEEYLEEEVKFSFLPRFKQHPELKSMYSSIDEAEKLLNSEGEPTKNSVEKFFKLALRILDIYYNICSVITLPMCILIAPIISHLIGRGIEYAIKCGEVLVAESSTKKAIEKLNKVKKETKDPKIKEKCEKQIKSLSDKLSKLKQNESEIDENPTITADLDRLMLKDGESSVEDLKNLNNLDSSNSFIADLEEGATTSDLDNVMNTVNDEDIMPDSEGALNDGDDIDSLNESSLKFL